MQYGQIVFLLFTALVLYYAALIALDIQKARAAQAAEQVQRERKYTAMIKLCVGVKGTGKTKTLIDETNKALSASKGNVVCLEKGAKLRYCLLYTSPSPRD